MATYAISNPADLANLALSKIGYKLRIGSVFDGSDAANAVLDIYVQTRDYLLRTHLSWNFSQRMVVGTLLKSAPAGGYFDAPWNPTDFPPVGWKYSYALPDNYLEIRAVRPTPGFLNDMAPTPNLMNVVNDNGYTPPRRVLVCNLASAVVVYTAQIYDLTDWPVDAVEFFAAALGERLAAQLASLDLKKIEAQEEAIIGAGTNVMQG